jgi:hypothetical protein
MKNFTLLILLALIALTTQAQSVLRYEFNNTLAEKNGNGPALTPLSTEGVFTLDTLNEINGTTKTVYRFDLNCGLQFNNAAAGNFIGTTYSIEIYFVFDNLNSWKRVVDWKNRKTDYGAYVYYGELNFYPFIYSDDAPVVAGEYTYYVVTRDGATNQTLIYTDADEEIEMTDANGDALVDGDQVINFFFDDLVVPNEASSGAVALINLYDYVLDSMTVKQNFENLGGQVFSVGEKPGTTGELTIFPNPSAGTATISIPGLDRKEAEIEVYNLAGQKVFSRSFAALEAKECVIAAGSLPEGLYVVRARSGHDTFSKKLMIGK